MSDDDKLRREVIMRVMCDLSLDYAAMSQQLGVDFAKLHSRFWRQHFRIVQR